MQNDPSFRESAWRQRSRTVIRFVIGPLVVEIWTEEEEFTSPVTFFVFPYFCVFSRLAHSIQTKVGVFDGH